MKPKNTGPKICEEFKTVSYMIDLYAPAFLFPKKLRQSGRRKRKPF